MRLDLKRIISKQRQNIQNAFNIITLSFRFNPSPLFFFIVHHHLLKYNYVIQFRLRAINNVDLYFVYGRPSKNTNIQKTTTTLNSFSYEFSSEQKWWQKISFYEMRQVSVHFGDILLRQLSRWYGFHRRSVSFLWTALAVNLILFTLFPLSQSYICVVSGQ